MFKKILQTKIEQPSQDNLLAFWREDFVITKVREDEDVQLQ